MNRREFLTRLGLSAAALAVGVKPISALLEAEPPVLQPVAPITLADLHRIFREAYVSVITEHLGTASPLTALFRERVPDGVGGRALVFPVTLG